MDLKSVKSIHFTGIKGVGLTALALCAQDLGIKVTGSDTAEEFPTDAILQSRGIAWQIGFDPSHLPPSTSLLIYTAAHKGPLNPQVIEAKRLNIPTLSHAQALALFMQAKRGIAVCGVGGKTTTTAMLATILQVANRKPSFAIGAGNVPSLGVPAKYDRSGQDFVAEADEYFAAPGIDDTPKFLYLDPEITIVTNISYDHPDVYPNLEATKSAYLKFFDRLPSSGLLIAFADNPTTIEVARQSGKALLTYGTTPHADWQLVNFHPAAQKSLFTVKHTDITHEFSLPVPGKFNALNALAAIAAAVHLGIDLPTCAKGLRQFTGTMRRFQVLGDTHGLTIVDDYAHHPSEITATLTAAKDWFPGRRLIAIFQPHTYSRTQALFTDFAKSFAAADEVIFLPIYASARESANSDTSSEKLTQATAQQHPHASYQADRPSLLQYLEVNTQPDDVILTLGAGDIFSLGPWLLHNL